MKPVTVALLGAGSINQVVAEAVLAGRLPNVKVVTVAGSSPTSSSAAKLAAELNVPAVAPDALASSGATWVLEAAGVAAVRAHVPGLWAAGVNTIIMSIGALIEAELLAAYQAARGVRIMLPSGAIAGLDGVRAMAATASLTSARITTTKKPAGLSGAPFLVTNGIELPEDEAVTVFTGSAREAVAGFPANVNVAVALSLAGIGPDATEVVVRSDPAAPRSQHVIEAEGPLASIEVRVTSEPSPGNARSSYLAGASAVAALREISMGRG